MSNAKTFNPKTFKALAIVVVTMFVLSWMLIVGMPLWDMLRQDPASRVSAWDMLTHQADPTGTLQLRRLPGEAARKSRCVECTQPGDTMLVRGPHVTSIRAYLDRQLVAACDGCDSLALPIASMGPYVVLGLLFRDGEDCALGWRSLDEDKAALFACGARVIESRFESR